MQRPTSGSFMKELKLKDKRLDCYLHIEMSRRRGLKDPLYVITYDRGHGEPIVIRVIHDGDWGYRYPDGRDLKWLGDHDATKEEVKRRLDDAAYLMEQYKEKHDKQVDDEFHAVTLDAKHQLADIAAKLEGRGKGHKALRRVITKPKGETFEVIDRRRIKQNDGGN